MKTIKCVQPRKHKKTVSMSDSEKAAFERYCQKYKITNQSELIRRVLLNHIYEQTIADYPTLWSKQELAKWGCL
ncbi:MAG TPA: hypothetical protein PK990_08780 [Salinivirgaceae bacterium]|nr:hypothetical protein [Salinivirgaceae bacterium]